MLRLAVRYYCQYIHPHQQHNVALASATSTSHCCRSMFSGSEGSISHPPVSVLPAASSAPPLSLSATDLPPSSQLNYKATRTPYSIVYITVPNTDIAEKLAADLVDAYLAACVNIIPRVVSVYRWKGAIERSEELLLIVKTRHVLFSQVREFVEKQKFAEVPEIIEVTLSSGHDRYLDWIQGSTKAAAEEELSKEEKKKRKREEAMTTSNTGFSRPGAGGWKTVSTGSMSSSISSSTSSISTTPAVRKSVPYGQRTGPGNTLKCEKHRRWKKTCPPDCPDKLAMITDATQTQTQQTDTMQQQQQQQQPPNLNSFPPSLPILTAQQPQPPLSSMSMPQSKSLNHSGSPPGPSV